MIYNPATGLPEVYKQAVLPFGSVASVTAFLRCALGIWHIGSGILKLAWTSYFDDFLSLTPAMLDQHTEICVSTLFQLLGWKLSSDKLVPYSQCCKVLGVEINLHKSPKGMMEVMNTEARKTELVDCINEILAKRELSRFEGERLRGRLQFASNQLFGRRFRNYLRDLNGHVSRGFRVISDEFAKSLAVMVELLTENLPRPIDVNFMDWTHVYVDASFEPSGYSGLGGLVLDSAGNCLDFFSEEVTEALTSRIKRDDQQTIIFELEGLAIAVALHVFEKHIKGKRVVIFTDNQSAQSCVVKCKSSNHNMNLIVRSICSSEERLGLMSWIERVPSQSNPADELSRKKVIEYAGLRAKPINILERWEACTAELHTKSSQK